jgi:hypothetical protein
MQAALLQGFMRKQWHWTLGENKPKQSQFFDDSTALTAGFAQSQP